MKKGILSVYLLSALMLPAMAQRKVLIEQFTNSGCPPCALYTPPIAAFVNSSPGNVLMLAYHTSFPYLDSMYHENAIQSDSRVAYYGLGAVPYSVVDGNYFAGPSPVLAPNLSTTVTNRLMDAPGYEIGFTYCTFNPVTNMLSCSAEFLTLEMHNPNDSLVIHFVVAEKNVLKSSYLASPGNNSETEYPWVVRMMADGTAGSALLNQGLGAINYTGFNNLVTNFKDISQMRVIAFVQNFYTHEIYQSEIAIPSGITGLTENKALSFNIYPTVTNGVVYVSVRNNELKSLMIFDVTGKFISEIEISSETSEIADLSFLTNGMYFLKPSGVSMEYAQKIIINK